MRVCHVLPPQLAHPMMHEGTVVNQMLLAQEARYLDWSPLRDSAPEGVAPYIVTDSGSWELGTPIGIQELMEFTEFHKADAVILPDVGADGPETRRLVEESMEYLAGAPHPSCEYVAACQSLTWEGIEEDLDTFAELGIQHVGMSSKLIRKVWSETIGANRPGILRSLRHVLWEHGMTVHLLGLMERPSELYEIATDPELRDLVSSVDTASALRWAFFDSPPVWWPQVQVPRYIWEDLTERDLPSEVWQRWALNRRQLEDWAQGKL